MHLRPSSADDHPAVLRLLAERDRADFNEPGFTDPVVEDQWRLRDFDPARDAVVAEDETGLIGYAAVFHPGDLAFVHPEREGEGIGTQLLHWAEERARPRGTWRQRVGARNQRARALLESAGYHRARSNHTLAWSGHPSLPSVRLPEGVTLEAIDPDRDAAEVHALDLAAFAENPDYSAETLDGFVSEHFLAPELHRASTRIARQGPTGVGFVVCRRTGTLGLIDLLAVLAENRRQGIGRALLCHAISSLTEDGALEVRLDVASDNPRALRLYRSIGMTDRHEVMVYERSPA